MARLLIVQNDTQEFRALDQALVADSHRVVAKRTALQAMEFLAVYSPDLIVIDNELQGMDGMTLLALIRGVPRLRDIPVVMVTDNLPQHAEQMTSLRPHSVLYKPARSEDIRKAITEVLSLRLTLTLEARTTQIRPPSKARSRLQRHLPNEKTFREIWAEVGQRTELLLALEQAGWDEAAIFRRVGRSDVDLYDAIGSLAYSWPLKSRVERAQFARHALLNHPEFVVINALLSVYEEKGLDALELPDTLQMIYQLEDQIWKRLRGLRGYMAVLYDLETRLFPVSGIPAKSGALPQ